MVSETELAQAETQARQVLATQIPERRFGAGVDVRRQQQELLQRQESARENLQRIEEARQQEIERARQQSAAIEEQRRIQLIREAIRQNRADFGTGLNREDRQLVANILASGITGVGQRFPPELLIEGAVGTGARGGILVQSPTGEVREVFSSQGQPRVIVPQAASFRQTEVPIASSESGGVIVQDVITGRQRIVAPQSEDNFSRERFRDEVPTQEYSRQILFERVQRLKEKAQAGINYGIRSSFASTSLPRGFIDVIDRPDVLRRQQFEQQNNLNDRIDSFNKKYNGRQLTQEEIIAAQQEEQELFAEQGQITTDEQIAAAEQDARFSDLPLPERFIIGGVKGSRALAFLGLETTAAGFGALAGDKESTQFLAQLIPRQEDISGKKQLTKEERAARKEQVKEFLLDPIPRLAEFGVPFFFIGGASALRKELATPTITPIKTPTKFKSLEAQVTVIPTEAEPFVKGKAIIKSTTPEQFAVQQSKLDIAKQEVAKDFERLGMQRISDKLAESGSGKIISLRKEDVRNTLIETEMEGGLTTRGVTASKRRGGDITKVSRLAGYSADFDIKKIDTSLSDIEKFTLQKGIGKDTFGFIPTGTTKEPITFFRGELESELKLRATKREATIPPFGRRTTRASTISAVQKAAEIQFEEGMGFELLKVKTALKDITLPTGIPTIEKGIIIKKGFKRSGKIPTIEGGIVVKTEPIIQEEIGTGAIPPRLSGEQLQELKLGKQRAAANLQAQILQEQVKLQKQINAAQRSAVSRARARGASKDITLQELSRIAALPTIIGGGGRQQSDFVARGAQYEVSDDLSSFFPKTASFELLAQPTVQAGIPKQIPKEVPRQIDKAILKEIARTIETPRLKEIERLALKELTKQIEKPIERLKPRPIMQPPRRPQRQTLPKLGFGLLSDKETEDDLTGRYNVFVRRYGKFRQIGTELPKEKAIKVGREKVLRTLARTVKFVPLGKSETDINLEDSTFRRPTARSKLGKRLTFVQRSRKSLSSDLEKLEIQQARKSKRRIF